MRVYLNEIREPSEVDLAVKWGASAIGIRIGYGKDYVHPEKAREIFMRAPLFISRVGIFSQEKRYVIQELVTFCELDSLHFTGNENPSELENYSEHLIKTFSPHELSEADKFSLEAVYVDLDSYAVPQKLYLPEGKLMIISGNLNEDHWVEIAEKFHPYAVGLKMAEAKSELVRSLLVL